MDIDAVRAGRDPRLPGEGRRAAASTSATCTRSRATARSPATRATSSGTVTLEVEVVKGLRHRRADAVPGAEDLPFLARPLTAEERSRALALARRHGIEELEETAPISVVGTGPDLNSATDNGLARAADLLGMTVPEVKNRATVTGAIEIGRAPGVVHVTFRAPTDRLEARGLLPYARELYGG